MKSTWKSKHGTSLKRLTLTPITLIYGTPFLPCAVYFETSLSELPIISVTNTRMTRTEELQLIFGMFNYYQKTRQKYTELERVSDLQDGVIVSNQKVGRETRYKLQPEQES
ncbi:hypothetical protein D1872_288630 [compost metagenome]